MGAMNEAELRGVKDDYLSEDVAKQYDSKRFSSFAGRTFDRLERYAIDRTLHRVDATTPRPRILDAPCGTGRITSLLLKRGYRVTGGDISVAMISVAQSRCRQYADRMDFRVLDLDEPDTIDREFDLVTCVRLFHHLGTDHRGRILVNLARMTRRYVLINIALDSWYCRLRRRVKRLLKQGISRASSSWADVYRESKAAGLKLVAARSVCPFVSEDMILLFELNNV